MNSTVCNKTGFIVFGDVVRATLGASVVVIWGYRSKTKGKPFPHREWVVAFRNNFELECDKHCKLVVAVSLDSRSRFVDFGNECH